MIIIKGKFVELFYRKILFNGQLTKEQKEELIKKLTEISSEIMHIPSEFFLTTIKELPDENIGIGGKTIDKTKKEYMDKQH